MAAVPPCDERPPVYRGADERVVSGSTGSGALAESYFAVLPRAYSAEPERRYPVVVLLHGYGSSADEYLVCMDLLRLSADDDVIVVLPQGSPDGFWVDGFGAPGIVPQRRESALLQSLLPHVDQRFRTLPARERRAIAGLSMGGFGAFTQAVRHPELFSAVAGFSPLLAAAHLRQPDATWRYLALTGLTPGTFGDPFTPAGVAWRRAHDISYNAARLRSFGAVYVASGNGVPCDLDETARLSEPDISQPIAEPLVRKDHDLVVPGLLAAGVPVVSRRFSCGAHTFRTFQRALEEAWPMLVDAVTP
jgi:S-formylglutathione hydrolase FrmB